MGLSCSRTTTATTTTTDKATALATEVTEDTEDGKGEGTKIMSRGSSHRRRVRRGKTRAKSFRHRFAKYEAYVDSLDRLKPIADRLVMGMRVVSDKLSLNKEQLGKVVARWQRNRAQEVLDRLSHGRVGL